MNSGTVYLVGAGPGHPDLLTVKALRLLQGADVVVYDRLVLDAVLRLAPAAAERVFMGKAPGGRGSRQEEINQLLVAKACEGKTVVRLKSGDPFVFGRGAEEVEYLVQHGIPCEVVPGISSALAAPLAAGIAVTHRAAASSLAIVTGHELGSGRSRVDWAALARLDTLVFLMAVENLGGIVATLIEHGRPSDTGAALIQKAFWPEERVLVATLGTIADEAARAGIEPPATLVVGHVVQLRERLRLSPAEGSVGVVAPEVVS